MAEPKTFDELQARYGTPERADSAMSIILAQLGISAAFSQGCIVMIHRYHSEEGFDAYKNTALIPDLIVPDNWLVTWYGPAFIGPGVYGAILITSKGKS